MDAPGKGILKVVSILFIIFGAIATIFSIIALVGSAALTSLTDGLGVVQGLSGILIVASIIALVGSAAELVIGILGVGKSDDVSKCMFFIVTGFVLCAINLISMIMFFQVTSLIGFVLPVLYIVGGFMNKNAKAA